MAAKITGRVEILLNGTTLLNKAGAVASGIGISGEQAVEKKSVFGDSGIHGFVDENVEARLEVTITDRDDISLSDIAKVDGDGTIIFRSQGGGKGYILDQATCVRNFSLTAGEGETTVAFVGNFWTESAT